MTVRELVIDDYPSVMAVRARNGLSVPARGEWEHLLVGNPARPELPAVPPGWVLELPDAGVAGVFLNLPMRAWFRGRALRVAAASGWVVDELHRSHTFGLLARYFTQRDVDLLLCTTANLASASAFGGFRGHPVPSGAAETDAVAAAHAHESLLWVTGHRNVARSALRRQRLPSLLAPLAPLRPLLAQLLGTPAGLASRLIDAMSRPLPRATRLTAVAEHEIDDRFDALWDRLRAGSTQLIGWRSAATLRWTFAGLFRRGGALLALERRGELVGYIALGRRDRLDEGLRGYRIVDLQTLSDVDVAPLLGGALRHARDEGIHVVDAVGFGLAKRDRLLATRPRKRALKHWPFVYRASDAPLAATLADPSSWDVSPYDGDATAARFRG